jgi:hypothetical protein
MDSTSYSIVTQGSFGSNPGPDSLEQAACPDPGLRNPTLELPPGRVATVRTKQALKAKGKQTYTQFTWR